jgi:hypothetical protein
VGQRQVHASLSTTTVQCTSFHNLRHSQWFVRRGHQTGVRETAPILFPRGSSVPFGTSMRGERNYAPVSTLERMEPT